MTQDEYEVRLFRSLTEAYGISSELGARERTIERVSDLFDATKSPVPFVAEATDRLVEHLLTGVLDQLKATLTGAGADAHPAFVAEMLVAALHHHHHVVAGCIVGACDVTLGTPIAGPPVEVCFAARFGPLVVDATVTIPARGEDRERKVAVLRTLGKGYFDQEYASAGQLLEAQGFEVVHATHPSWGSNTVWWLTRIFAPEKLPPPAPRLVHDSDGEQ